VGNLSESSIILRGDFKAHEYGQVILPFVVLRRLECVLAETKSDVIAKNEALKGKVENVDRILQRTPGQRFYNLSPLDLTALLQDPVNVASNLRTYIAGFSPGATEVLERYKFDDKVAALDRAGLLYQIVVSQYELSMTLPAGPAGCSMCIYVDMDGVLVDLQSGLDKVGKKMRKKYKKREDEIPRIFSLIEPSCKATSAIHSPATKK
jgi:type I restriction-modification system DNA methylase subunit